MKRIFHFVKIHRECLEKSRTDPFGNFSEAARNYKVEITTNIFLLIINITEFTTIITYATGIFPLVSHSNTTIRDSCNELHLDTIELRLAIANPLFSILISAAQVGLLFSIALGICLVKYLHITYHEISVDPFQFIKRFLILTSLIGIFLLITGSVPQLMIIEKLLEPIILFIYFCISVKYNRIFYKTLQWRSIEYKMRGRSNCIVRRSIISRYQFAIIMSCLSLTYICSTLAEFISQYFFLIATAIYDGPCLFNYLYGTGYYRPLLTTQQQINTLKNINEVFRYITSLLVSAGLVLFGIEYSGSSVLFLVGIFWKKFRFHRANTRFTPSLMDPFLYNQAD